MSARAAPDRIWSPEREIELSHVRATRAFPLHLHPEAIVAVIVAGAEVIEVDGRREVAETGSLVMFEPECPHRTEPLGAEGVCYRGFYVDRSLITFADARPRIATHVVRNPRLAKELVAIHRSVEARPEASTLADAKRVVARALDLFSHPHAAGAVPDEVREIASRLRAGCAERLRWPELAHSVGVSPAHLARRFTAFLGVPPHLYQTQFRIALAKRLLRRELPLATVALQSGFSDQSHLTHQFVRYVGQTPATCAKAQTSTRQ